MGHGGGGVNTQHKFVFTVMIKYLSSRRSPSPPIKTPAPYLYPALRGVSTRVPFLPSGFPTLVSLLLMAILVALR